VYFSGEQNFSYGDILKISGETNLPTKYQNDKGFDYSKYLKTEKIVAMVFCEKVEFIKKEDSILAKIYSVKQKCVDILEENFEQEQAELLKAILLGEKSGISHNQSEIFSKSGLAHILAISGLHVSYVVLFTEKFLNKIINNIKIRNGVLIFFLIVYIIFTGGSPSVVRACIMMILYYIAKIVLRERDFYRSFILSFAIILIVNPFNIYSMSMWLSFLGSLGIVLLSDFIKKIIIRKMKLKRRHQLKILEAIVISISAQILIFPLIWKVFGNISLTFWISNLLVAELVAPILVLGYISIIIFPIREIFVFVESILLKVFLKLAFISSKMPYNRIFIVTPSIFTIFVYYSFILQFILFYKNHKFTVLKCIFNYRYLKRKILKHREILKKAIIALMIVIFVLKFVQYMPKDLRINFLSVGQGDCTLIRTKYNKVVLIDSGEGQSEKYDYGKNVVLPYLLSHNISKIDYLVISHFDSDHCGRSFFHLRKL